MHSATFPHQTQARARSRRPRWLRPGVLWFAFDLLVPTALLYAVLWLGGGLYLALLASASLSAVSALVSYRIGGRQGFAPVMLALALAAFAIALVTGSDRFLLAKESVLTAVVGFWFIGSLWQERPLAYRFSRPLLEGRFGAQGPPWEVLWARDAHFRHIWQVSTVMWGVATRCSAW